MLGNPRRKARDAAPALALAALAILALWLLSGLYGLYGSKAEDAAETQGYSGANATACHKFFVGWRGCSGSDAWACEVSATNPAGRKVEVEVCMGWALKGATVRSR